MYNDVEISPAELAAQKAMSQVISCIDNKCSFVFEAGAGAGKTYSLIESLHYIIQSKGNVFLRKNQQIACITYTNVAKEEIKKRTDGHPIVFSETIHAFCWYMLSSMQSAMRKELPTIGAWSERISDICPLVDQKILYTQGYPSISEMEIYLHHGDVIELMSRLLYFKKFRQLLISRFPIIFIDEYQDTAKIFVDSLLTHFIKDTNHLLAGFFGDSWQKIYGREACGKIEDDCLERIDKMANFRSERVIVDFLNKLRPTLKQEPKDPLSYGTVQIFHTNSCTATRRTGQHWGGDLPSDEAHKYLELLKSKLCKEGWDFSSELKNSRILMLTHNVLASEQGYFNLARVFSNNNAFIKKEDAYIAFFADILEPVCTAYESKRFGEMFNYIGNNIPKIIAGNDKSSWICDMSKLIELRKSATIGEVILHLITTQRPRLSPKVEEYEQKYLQIQKTDLNSRTEEQSRLLERLNNLKSISYQEVVALVKFIEDKTPFSTEHGVKGAEFENVLVVVGRGWNNYNFVELLELIGRDSIPESRLEFFERNRNLFYVCCSRPKKKLVLLFTQELSDAALSTLTRICDGKPITALPPL